MTRPMSGWEGSYGAARFYMVHFRSRAKELLRFGVAWHYQSPAGATLIAQDDSDIWTLHVVLQDTAEVTSIDAKQLLYDALGCEFPVEILQANPVAAHLVVAAGYGRGRVWMAGIRSTSSYPPVATA